MTDNLDLLQDGVRAIIEEMDAGIRRLWVRRDTSAWQTIRAELLRLAQENAELRTEKNRWFISAREWAELSGRFEAERDELRRRIEDAPVCTLSRSDVDAWDLPDNWSGKRVRLVVEDAE